jgi:hypothetical protein
MAKRTCIIEGCDKHRVGRGLCSTHYYREKQLSGPFPEKTLIERFEEKIEPGPDGCWNWTGALVPCGYGQKWDGTRVVPAHRWSYEYHIGPIPEGLHIDHLCRNRRCVNPWHLEPVTPQVNSLRGKAGEVNGARGRAKTHCPYGHEYTPENTYRHKRGDRQCRTCKRLRDAVDRRLGRWAAPLGGT